MTLYRIIFSHMSPKDRKVWVLAERPSFTGGSTDSAAYGWFWWDLEHQGPTELGVLSWR